MAARGIKKKAHENLTDTNIEKVIGLLNAEKPITKKEACEILNISYNPARLKKIIEDFEHRKELDAKRRKANRGKPASALEIQHIVQGVLDGDSRKEIADLLYRPIGFVKQIVEKSVGMPEKGESYFKPALIPEQAIAERFKLGQIVWASRYNTLAIVCGETAPGEEGNKRDYYVYRIFTLEPIEEISPYFPQYQGYGGQFADQAAFDLGSLEHLKSYGVDIYRPYREHFKNWLSGDFSGMYGSARWDNMKTTGKVQIYQH